MQFGMLVFPNVQQLDLTGPYEVSASWPGARVRHKAVKLSPQGKATGPAEKRLMRARSWAKVDVSPRVSLGDSSWSL
jgi:hypothetical protein